MNNKKGQAALEFLMTYGWAILVVLVAIGALAFFGVLSPDKFLPSKCLLQVGLVCVDQKVTPSVVTVVVKNNFNADITVNDVRIQNCGASGAQGSLANGAQATYAISCAAPIGSSGSKFSAVLNVSYTNADSGITKSNLGEISGKIE